MARALFLQGGTMRGAFLVGVLKTFYHRLGAGYFDAIFATSVGVFEQAFFAASQPKFMENTWREYVHGQQLINVLNPLKGKPILDLDYLVGLFQSDKSLLNLEQLNNSHPQLFAFLAEYETKEPKVFNLKTENVFEIMKATCALPVLYPKPVIINGRRYVDTWITPTNRFQNLLMNNLKDFSEIIAVSTYQVEDDSLSDIKNVIRPTKMPLWGTLDTNRNRIIKTIEQGEIDAERYLRNL